MYVTRLRTTWALLALFTSRQRWFLMPLVIVLVLTAGLFVATGAMPALAPFVYIAF